MGNVGTMGAEQSRERFPADPSGKSWFTELRTCGTPRLPSLRWRATMNVRDVVGNGDVNNYDRRHRDG